jgi:hypothetical protein
LFEHDLRDKRIAFARGKTGSHFSGSCPGGGAFRNRSLFRRQAASKRPPTAEDSRGFVISCSERLAAAMVLGNVARLRVTANGTGFDQE